MTYSIIGSGKIGSALARHFARQGISVTLANSRGPESLAPLAKEIGSLVLAQTIQSALKADMVILALPFTAVAAIANAGGPWKGRIIVDATNAIDMPAFTPTDLGGKASSEVVAEKLPGAHIVKAFNTLPAAVLAADPAQNGGRRVLFLAGNNADANSKVSSLIAQLGFAPLDLGALTAGGLLQQFGGPLPLKNLVQLG
jgi:hypothetical protein